MMSPRTDNIPRAPPLHPARGAFNKAENRKSIRVMADYKRKTLQKDHQPKESTSGQGPDKSKDEMKLSRRMSMWGHRVVEVTASKLNLGQLPLSTPESPAEDKPQTLNWVKGELIGKGSYGRVYIALNISTGDMMAVKQVELPATERDRNDRKQLGQIESLRVEIALLKDMYHPNIVAYLGFETSPEYLSM
jgi:mitogen-activated protein kinase kinase kinase